ncbi:MAG: hypothetical protein IJ650_05975 [Paludibacteraceae bacterium]|nr:hypothetical protein [Paludibacteraceae bacterium]
MKKIIAIVLAAVMAAPAVFAQEKNKEWNEPKVGDIAIGFTFNPVSLASRLAVQPRLGTAVNGTVAGNMAIEKQMYALSQDPVAAFRIKYRFAENWNLRASLGLSGSHINYTEYVQDDLAKTLDPLSENKVADVVKSDLNSGNLAIGAEFVKGKKLKFVMGFSVLYAIGGGMLKFDYGNKMTELNKVPSSLPYSGWISGATPALNPDAAAGAAQGIAWARPLKTNNSGIHHGLGVQMDMGIEWFFQDRISLGAAVTFTPIMFTFQPQTYTIMEGFSTTSGQVEQYNMLVSPGGWSCLYGTENLGFQVSLNYYF